MATGLCGLGAGISRAKWWSWALLGLLVITMLMWFTKRIPIENDIQTRTKAELSSQGHDWATVDLDRRGRNVALGGAAPSLEARLSAIDIAENVYGVDEVEDLTTELELGSATFGLNHRNDKIYLTGALPTQNLIDASVTAASRAYGAEHVVNGLNVDIAVKSPGWLEGVNVMMPDLASLRESKVEMSDEGVILEGLVDSEEVKNRLIGAAQDVFDLGVSESIIVQPNVISAEELAVTVTAEANAKAKAAAEEIAMEQVAVYEAERLAMEKAQAEAAARVVAEIKRAEAAATTESLRLAEEEIKAEVARLAAEQAAERAAFIAKCQSQLNAVMEGETISFATGSDSIGVTSYSLLDRVAGLVADCQEALREMGSTIEVAGHTDTIGDAGFNMDLSGRRANAVRDYLLTKGAPFDLLNANGYGGTKTIADDATDAGRAQNRRIQFDIKQ
ncbi:MAG: OOP family OmpA-OmpF porin [Gammaproteobacteria bacterium]|jgi:OOP family OmpA-OmpF porin